MFVEQIYDVTVRVGFLARNGGGGEAGCGGINARVCVFFRLRR